MAKMQNELNLYNKLLVTQAVNYHKLGYADIRINNENYTHGQPNKVGGYTPDLSAVLEDTITLCEVVTKDLMDDPKTIEKWRTFNRSGYEFHMVISKAILSTVKDIAKSNGIIVNKFWVVNTAKAPAETD